MRHVTPFWRPRLPGQHREQAAAGTCNMHYVFCCLHGHHPCTHLGVGNGEADGHGQVDPGLQEGNDLSTRAGGGDDQHILRVCIQAMRSREWYQRPDSGREATRLLPVRRRAAERWAQEQQRKVPCCAGAMHCVAVKNSTGRRLLQHHAQQPAAVIACDANCRLLAAELAAGSAAQSWECGVSGWAMWERTLVSRRMV